MSAIRGETGKWSILGSWPILVGLFLVGCPPPDPLEVCSVEVIPARVYAVTGRTFLLEARFRNCEKEVITDPNVAVSWSGPRGVHFLPGNKYRTRVSIDPEIWPSSAQPEVGSRPPGQDLGIPRSVGAFEIEIRRIHASVGDVKSDEAVVMLGEPVEAPGRDRIVVTYDQPSFPTVVLFDGFDGAVCLRDEILAVVAQAYLPKDITRGCGKRGAELSVLSPTRRGVYDANPESHHSLWGKTVPGEVSLDLGEKDTVDLVLWQHARASHFSLIQAGDPFSFILADLKKAQGIFDLSRVGVHLRMADTLIGSTTPPVLIGPEEVGEPFSEFDIAKCDDASYVQEKLPRLDLNAEKIYVVYVGLVYSGTPDKPQKGKTCLPTATRSAPLVILAAKTRHVTTLAHELGHAMGLNSATLPNSGHTKGLKGFDRSNIMWEGNDLDGPGERERFSVGQAFRINADCRGWVFSTGREGSSLCCQCEPFENEPCPFYVRDVAKVYGMGNTKQCFVTPPCPCSGGT